MNDPHEPSDDALDPRLAAAIEELPEELSPGRDLYPGVRRRIRDRRIARRTLALAAAIAVAALAWSIQAPRREAPGGARRTAALPGGARESVVPASVVGLTAFSESDRALAEIRVELRRQIEANQERLPPATRALVFENLATIDRAISEIERALAAEPGNAALGRTYIDYREREIDLLRQANRAAARL